MLKHEYYLAMSSIVFQHNNGMSEDHTLKCLTVGVTSLRLPPKLILDERSVKLKFRYIA